MMSLSPRYAKIFIAIIPNVILPAMSSPLEGKIAVVRTILPLRAGPHTRLPSPRTSGETLGWLYTILIKFKEMNQRMVFIAVDPKTHKVKEYKNSGEWLKEVDGVKTKTEKPIEVKTYLDASKRLKKELGIDLRTPAEKEQARIDEAVGKAVSAALARPQQATQSPLAALAIHSDMTVAEIMAAFRSFKPAGCRCAHASHSQKAEQVIHSQGPTMTAEAVSWEEAQSRLRAAGIYGKQILKRYQAK